jgi:hypothetical protein
MDIVCEPVVVEAAPEEEAAEEPTPPKPRGRPKGAPNKPKPKPAPAPAPAPEPEPAPAPAPAPRVRAKAKAKPTVVEEAAEEAPEPTVEELLGHMGRALTRQRAARAQQRAALYSQFLS